MIDRGLWFLLRPASIGEALALRVALIGAVIVLLAAIAHYERAARPVHVVVTSAESAR